MPNTIIAVMIASLIPSHCRLEYYQSLAQNKLLESWVMISCPYSSLHMTFIVNIRCVFTITQDVYGFVGIQYENECSNQDDQSHSHSLWKYSDFPVLYQTCYDNMTKYMLEKNVAVRYKITRYTTVSPTVLQRKCFKIRALIRYIDHPWWFPL